MDVGNRGRRFVTLGEGLPRGLEREARPRRRRQPGEASPIPNMRVGALFPAAGVQPRSAPTQRRKE